MGTSNNHYRKCTTLIDFRNADLTTASNKQHKLSDKVLGFQSRVPIIVICVCIQQARHGTTGKSRGLRTRFRRFNVLFGQIVVFLLLLLFVNIRFLSIIRPRYLLSDCHEDAVGDVHTSLFWGQYATAAEHVTKLLTKNGFKRPQILDGKVWEIVGLILQESIDAPVRTDMMSAKTKSCKGLHFFSQ